MDRREMRLGLDLRGGTRLVLEADISQQPNVNLDDALNSAKDIVERRGNAFGVAGTITGRAGADPIAGQLPGISSDEAVNRIGRTAQLRFMEIARDENNQALVKNPDGSTSPIDMATALSPSTIEDVVFIPVSAVDSNGVRHEITGTYLNRD